MAQWLDIQGPKILFLGRTSFPHHFTSHLASRKLRDTALSRKSCDFDLAFFDEGLTTVV